MHEMNLKPYFLVNAIIALFFGVNCFELIVLHNSHIMGRYDQIRPDDSNCLYPDSDCMGGIGRIYHVIKEHRKLPNVLYLLAGNVLSGSPLTYLFHEKISIAFVNLIKPDAVNIGSHEFDYGIESLSRYVKQLKSPVVTGNVDFSKNGDLGKYFGSKILTVNGVRIGIVGYISTQANIHSVLGAIDFYDELKNVDQECALLANQGVQIIIAVGSATYKLAKDIAKSVSNVDIVIAGSYKLLYNGNPPSADKVADPYPKVITQSSGKKVLVVSSYAYNKYLGRLNVTFNDEGDIEAFVGQPIYMESSIPEDKDASETFDKFRDAYRKFATTVVGRSTVQLQGTHKICGKSECNFGNLVADAFVESVRELGLHPAGHWTSAAVGLANSGTIMFQVNPERTSYKLYTADVVSLVPNSVELFTVSVKGKTILQMLELAAIERQNKRFFQVSGLRVTFDFKRPKNQRVIKVEIRCANCAVPRYQPLIKNKVYTIVTLDYIVLGGYGYTMMNKYLSNCTGLNISDTDAVLSYIRKKKYVFPEVEGRIKVVGDRSRTCINVPVKNFGIISIYAAIVTYNIVLKILYTFN